MTGLSGWAARARPWCDEARRQRHTIANQGTHQQGQVVPCQDADDQVALANVQLNKVHHVKMQLTKVQLAKMQLTMTKLHLPGCS